MSTLFSGHTLNPPMHLSPQPFSPFCRLPPKDLPFAAVRAVETSAPSTLPHAVIHLGTMSKQANLPSTCPHSAHTLPTHTVRDARATCTLRALALLAFARGVKVRRCPWPGLCLAILHVGLC